MPVLPKKKKSFARADSSPPKAEKETRGATGVFPIVGIGASAGGLDAFVQLLKHLDVKTDMAFVLVQHLDPTHESLLSEILARATSMPVIEVSDGTAVVPNHVYVIPPNVGMTVVSGVLRLTPRRNKTGDAHCPIDEFLQSLAADCQEHAVGIVLSGTGSDGAKGVAAIVAAGGITFAQERSTAKFDGMPAAAIAAGVDCVLSPGAIAEELAIIARTPRSGRRDSEAQNEGRTERDAGDVQNVLNLLDAGRGMDFSHYKSPTVRRRIHRRMAMHRLTSAEDYAVFLKANPLELDNLYEDILVKVTSFFRVPESFAALKQHVFPALLSKAAPRAGPVRVWVPGCATGEEAYSIAICLLEYMDEIDRPTKIEIFATDVSDSALAKARIGSYAENIADHVSPKRLDRFFVKEGAGYRVGPRVRECCVFAKQNVARDPPFSRLDLISCRNLLIYLTPLIQKRILAAFHFALGPRGFLALGSAETIGIATDLFGVTDGPNKIFVRAEGVRGTLVPDFVMDALGKRSVVNPPFANLQSEPAKKLDVKGSADRAILAKFVPPGVVINERMEVLEIRGDISPYLMHPPGELTANLPKLCRPGLLVELRQAIQAARTSDEAVRAEGWIKTGKHQSSGIIIDVIPFTEASTAKRYFVVLFAQQPLSKSAEAKPTAPEATAIQRLDRELAETKAYLNDIIEKEQATNEELKSASEEILSANEELQSTNEEMATAKEETQATNEELTTVNDELQNRNQELGRLNSDLSNLFGSVQIPIVMLSEKLVIRRLTVAAEVAFNLTSADLGRPLADVGAKLKLDGLSAMVSEVLASLNTKDQEVQDRDGHWYSLRIKPYRTEDNKIEGVVLALVDIDSFKRSFEQLKEAHDFADAIVQTAPVPLLVLDSGLRVLNANRSFCQHFRTKEAETKGVGIFELGGGQWNVPRLRELLEDILPKNSVMENFTLDHEFIGLGRRTLRLSARRLVQKDGQSAKILLAIQDLTEEKRTEEDMTAAKDAAEFANRSKTDFLANMSHEIRTPLGVIQGYSELLADPDQSKADAIHSATRIRKNVEHLTELIDEILDIAKIEAGKLEVDRVRFALLPDLAETFTLLQSRAEAKGLILSISFDGETPEHIVACPKRLRQILFNIVGNALKFTEHGTVSITVKLVPARDGASKLSFAVKDSGCGLSTEQQRRLFRPFSQADSSVTRRHGGTGLGLVLARRLAEALGGNVVLTDSVVGKGSTFTVTIDPGPLTGAELLSGVNQAILERSKTVFTDWFAANQQLANVRVLLVDDGPDNQALLRHFLTASGASVDLGSNGAEAVEKALAGSYDLIFMDVQMPILDGYEATKRLRASGYKVPIVALTAHAMHGEREKCLAAGCNDYISKPVKPAVLIQMAAQAIKKKVIAPREASGLSTLVDDPIIGPLVEGFVKNLPNRVAAIHRAQQHLDWGEVASLAHQMSGAAEGYGFPELGKIAAKIESQAKHPNPKTLARSIAAFDSFCALATRAEGQKHLLRGVKGSPWPAERAGSLVP